MSTTDLEPVTGEIERRSPLLPSGLVDVDAARAAMANYQELSAAVLDERDWIGTPGEPGSFVKKSGWLALAKFYGLALELVGETKLERDDEGNLTRASARARATDPRDGRVSEAGGACARRESRFASSSGRRNIEHDLPASAETRAMNRAISNLIGFGAVSAEETDAGASALAPDLPEWAADIDDEQVDRLGDNLVEILTAAGVTDPAPVALELGSKITNYADGRFPAACALLAHLLARTIEPSAAAAEAEVVEPDGVTYGEPPATDPETET